MAIPLVINGATFEYPQDFDEDWGVDATGWAQAVTNGMLQMAGGNFPLTADVNFGANFGVLSKYFETRSSNPASVGTVRLSSVDAGVAWRNNANSGNLILTTDSSDNLLYNGHIINTSGASPVLSITGTANQVIVSSPTGNITLSTPQNIGTSSTPTFAGITSTGASLIQNGSALGFQNTGNTNTIAVKAPAVTTSYSLELPPNAGSSGQVLRTDGSGTTTWVDAAGGGTVNSGTTPNIPYYATSSNVLSDSGISRANLFLADGSVSASGAFNLNSHKVTNLTNGSSAQDATAFGQLSSGNAITAGGIANTTITATQIANSTITATQIANATITTTQIDSNTLTGSTANSGGSAGNMAQGTVSTPDFRANAVTQIQKSVSVGTQQTSSHTATTVTITTIGKPVIIYAQANVAGSTALILGSNVGESQLTLTNNAGTVIGQAYSQYNGAASAGLNYAFNLNINATETPAAGSNTYTLYYTATTSPVVDGYSLTVVELRA